MYITLPSSKLKKRLRTSSHAEAGLPGLSLFFGEQIFEAPRVVAQFLSGNFFRVRSGLSAVHVKLGTQLMKPWEAIAAAILGNATAIAILGWLTKSLLEKLLQRDAKRFEIEIKAKADATIEQLKSALQLRTIEHQVAFSGLHQKRASVIADLNGLLAETLWEAENVLSPWGVLLPSAHR